MPDARRRLTPAGLALRFALLLGVLRLMNITLGAWIRGLEDSIRPETLASLRRGVWITCLLYALLLALPFVPGVEVGLAMLSMFGAAVAPHVYIATVAGLTLAFGLGRLIPLPRLARLAGRLRMRKLAALLRRIGPMTPSEVLETLSADAPGRWGPFLIRNRHIALALLFNLPGNALIGGGGGIALVAGLSRLYSVPGFLLTVALAVAPVPLAVWLFGTQFLGAG